MTTTTADFHESNRASEVLAKIGSGSADADFARAVHAAIDRCQETMKAAKVVVTVEFDPDEDNGSITVRAEVTAKLPKLRAPASQMHIGAGGQLLTQTDWLMGGGRDESPLQAKPIEQAARAQSPSGRFPIVGAPAPAPLAAAAAPAPLAAAPAPQPIKKD